MPILSHKYRHAIALGFYFFLAALFIVPPLLAGKGNILGSKTGDLSAIYYHQWNFSRHTILHGEFPAWNHYTFCGNPFAANMETRVFYPLQLLSLPLPAAWGINLIIFVHWMLCGYFAWMLARKLGLRELPALLTGTVFMLAGPNIACLYPGHMSVIMVIAWFPLLLYMVECLANRISARRIAAGAAMFAFSILAGHPQILFYSSFLILVYTLLRASALGLYRGTRLIAAITAMSALGILISAMQLMPTWYMQKEGSRHDLSLADAATFSIAPRDFLTTFLPGLFGNNITSPFWGGWYPWVIALYVGVPTVFLLLIGLIHARRNKPMAAIAVIAGLSLLVALGASTPIFHVLFSAFPGFDFFRGPAKILSHAALAVALLAGFGLQKLCEERMTRAHAVALVLVILLASVGAAVAFHLRSDDGKPYLSWMGNIASSPANVDLNPDKLSHPVVVKAVRANLLSEAVRVMILGTLTFVVALSLKANRASKYIGVTFLLLILGDLYTAHRRYVSTFDGDVGFWRAAAEGFSINERVYFADPSVSPNVALSAKMHSVSGYESIFPRNFAELLNALNHRSRKEWISTSELSDPKASRFFSATVVLRAGGIQVPKEAISQRATIRHEWKTVSSNDYAWLALSKSTDLNEPVLIDQSSGMLSTLPTQSPLEPARIVSESPTALTVETSSDRGGILYLTDNLTSGWSMTLDGKPSTILRANYAFRGVELPAGKHTVVFRYQPPGLTTGIWLSVLGFVLSIFLSTIPAAWSARLRRTTSPAK
ncbi:MAG: YfhO family protein [Candidatus Sumerlaeota bacterium]